MKKDPIQLSNDLKITGYFNSLFIIKGKFLFLVLLFLCFLTSGCMNFYKVNTFQQSTGRIQPQLEKIKNQQRYYILHFADTVWHLNNFSLNEDKTELIGIAEYLPDSRMNYLKTKPASTNRYRKPNAGVVQEVHIYVKEYLDWGDSRISVPLHAVQKVEIYSKDTYTTVVAWVAPPIIVGSFIFFYWFFYGAWV
jgi:hypothetical protein